MDVEATAVLRRTPEDRLRPEARRAAHERLDLALEELALKPLDDDVVSVVRPTPSLAGCRALDAAHVATALFFRAADPELRLCTFDARMAAAAAATGLEVVS